MRLVNARRWIRGDPTGAAYQPFGPRGSDRCHVCSGGNTMKRTLSTLLTALLLPGALVAAVSGPASADPAITCANTIKTPMTGLIDGSVSVPDGASCFIQDATITGAFSAIHSPVIVS